MRGGTWYADLFEVLGVSISTGLRLQSVGSTVCKSFGANGTREV